MGSGGNPEKMKVIAYSDAGFSTQVGARYVQINPGRYTQSMQICYRDMTAAGSPGGSPSYNRTPSDQLDLELIFDSTGVVPPSTSATGEPSTGVTDEVTLFKELVFTYDGKVHQPNFLRLVWGTMVFDCRLKKLDFTYTLFKPDGSPLRATAKAQFVGFESQRTLALEANKSSPDLSHVRTVKAGDVLPLLCQEIYGTSAFYPQVAATNGLTDFRRLVAGTQLVFPPLAEAPR